MPSLSKWAALLLLPMASCLSIVGQFDEPGRFKTFESRENAQGEESLEVRLDLKVGILEIQPGDRVETYNLSAYYNEAAFEPKVDFQREGGKARLDFEMSGEGKSARRIRKTRVNLKLNPAVPISLETRTGVGETEIDLSGMQIAELRLHSGVGETSLAMLSPNPTRCQNLEIHSGVGALDVKGLGNFGFERMLFEGGVGGSQLDFSGNWDRVGQVDLRVGVGGLEIHLPRDVGAEIHSTHSFLSDLDLSDFRKEGNVYYSNNLERVEKRIRLNITAGIGGVKVRWN